MKNRLAQQAMAGVRLLMVLAVTALALGAWWFSQPMKRAVTIVPEVAVPAVVLSETTIRILNTLATPLDLRFFAPTEVNGLSPALTGYLARVESLLAEYQRVADGKLRVIKCDPQTDRAAKTLAGAAGVVPFASTDGEVVYLGLTIGDGVRLEAITPLAPEWEAALESDISRAVARLVNQSGTKPQSGNPAARQPAPIDPVVSEELLRRFPNLAAQSFDEIAKILREQTLEEFKQSAATAAAKVANAQQELAEAQAKHGEDASRVALEKFLKAQAAQSETLKAITARLQEQITVLARLKAAPSSPDAARIP